MERRRQFKVWGLSFLAVCSICLNSKVGAEKKRLYIKTESNPKQVHHHHYYTITDPMFGNSRNIPMKSRPEPETFDRMRYNRATPSTRFNHMDFYNDQPVHSDYQADHYHDEYDPYPKAARLLRMITPPKMQSPTSSYEHHQQPMSLSYQQTDIPEEPMPQKSSTRSRRVPTYRVSPDVYSSEFQRPFFSQNTDKHHNVRHVYTSEIVEDDY